MVNDEYTEIQLTCQDSPKGWVSVTLPNMGGTVPILTWVNLAVITQQLYVLNLQYRAVALVVWLEQNCVPLRWICKTAPGGCDNRASVLHQHSRVPQLRLLHGLISRPTITILMMYWIPACHGDYTKSMAENGDTIQSGLKNEPLSQIINTVKSRYASLNIQPTQSYQLTQIVKVCH